MEKNTALNEQQDINIHYVDNEKLPFVCPICGRLHFPNETYAENTLTCECGKHYSVTRNKRYLEAYDGDGLIIKELCFIPRDYVIGESIASKGYRVPLVNGKYATGLIDGHFVCKVNMKKLCRKLKRNHLETLRNAYIAHSHEKYWEDFIDCGYAAYVDMDNRYERSTRTELMRKVMLWGLLAGAVLGVVALNVFGFAGGYSILADIAEFVDGILIIIGLVTFVYAIL